MSSKTFMISVIILAVIVIITRLIFNYKNSLKMNIIIISLFFICIPIIIYLTSYEVVSEGIERLQEQGIALEDNIVNYSGFNYVAADVFLLTSILFIILHNITIIFRICFPNKTLSVRLFIIIAYIISIIITVVKLKVAVLYFLTTGVGIIVLSIIDYEISKK